MISKELSATLGFAVREAKKRRHEYVSIEHILFAILYDPTGIDIIENCGGRVENLVTSLEDFFEEKIERIPDAGIELQSKPKSRSFISCNIRGFGRALTA